MKKKNNDNFFRDIYRTLTPLGWFLIFTLIIFPFLLGWSWGYYTNSELLKIQSKTNGMEHTTNFEQLRGSSNYDAKR